MISRRVAGFTRGCGQLVVSKAGNCRKNTNGTLFQRLLNCSSTSSSTLLHYHYSTESGNKQEASTEIKPESNVQNAATEKKEDTVKKVEKSSFAKAVDKFSGQESFTKLLRNSTFVRMGDPNGKVVEGVIYHIISEDLYIDIGGKFSCVCLKPLKNPELYTLGTKVRVLVHQLELSSRFLGAATDLTVLEADGTLLGLLGDRKGGQQGGYIKEEGKSVSEELLASAGSATS